MIQAMRSSVSALRAAATSLGTTASNIANARHSGRLADRVVSPMDRARQAASRQERVPEELYRPLRADMVATAGGGVRAAVRRHDPPRGAAYDPGDPDAGGEELVARPDVDVADEMVRLREARDMYLANLRVVETADETAGYMIDHEA